MSAGNEALVAAAPVLDSWLAALQQFETDMGPNPIQWAANFPGAKLKLDGAVMLGLPQLATAEGGALQGIMNQQITALRGKLASAVAAAKQQSG